MKIQDFTNSPITVSLGVLMGQNLPIKFNYSLANFVSDWLSKKKNSSLVRAVRENQRLIRGNVSPEELDQSVHSVFNHGGKCLADLYHYYRKPDELIQKVNDRSEILKFIDSCQNSKTGTLLVTPHLSNFDMALLSLACQGLKAQVLTYSHPNGGYKIQNFVRENYALEVTPVTTSAIEKAFTRLKNGGVVATGVDRPDSSDLQKPILTFFQRPSFVPTGYIRMAIKTGARIVVAVTNMLQDGTYHVRFSEPIEMVRYPNKMDEIQNNGRKVLEKIEKGILDAPDQWLMFYPVWEQNS